MKNSLHEVDFIVQKWNNVHFSLIKSLIYFLGTSTVFHAGVIGEGKRKTKTDSLETEATNRNGLIFTSILFKLCNEVTVLPKEDTYKQLALLLVEVVSPDVMYNGLPWPEEDFTRYFFRFQFKGCALSSDFLDDFSVAEIK